MLTGRIVAGLMLLLPVASAQADEAVLLRYKMDKDDTLIYRNTAGFDQTQTFAGQEFGFEATHADVSVRTLQDVDDKGNLHVQTENKRLKVEMDSTALGKYAFDSTAPERDTSSQLGAAVTPLYDRLSGAILTIVVSPRGEIREVKGYKDLIGDVLKDNPIAAQFAGGGSEKGVELQMRQLWPLLPEKPVRPGDTWEEPYELELPQIGKVEGKTIYTFQGLEERDGRKLAKITTRTQLSLNLDINMNQATVTGTASIKDSSGTIYFDPERGQLVSLEDKATLTGNLNVAAGGQNIPIQMEQTQTAKSEQLDKLP